MLKIGNKKAAGIISIRELLFRYICVYNGKLLQQPRFVQIAFSDYDLFRKAFTNWPETACYYLI